MDDLWNQFLPIANAIDVARWHVVLLVAARIAGVFLVGPLTGRVILPWRVRLALVALLTTVVSSQLLSISETERDVQLARFQQPLTVTPESSSIPLPEVLKAVACDGITGMALGFSMMVFMSGMRLAGEWIDRHSGLGMGNVFDPDFTTESGASQLVSLFAIASILMLQPVNGHLQAVRLVLDSFRALPVGATDVSGALLDLPVAIVQQSLILGLRVALPFVVAMSLLDLTLGFVHRTTRWQFAPTACTFRIGLSLVILAATLPGIQQAISTSLDETTQRVQQSMVHH